MRKTATLILLILSLTAFSPALAQSSKFFIENESDTPFDAGPLFSAAQPLIQRGATVMVYLAQKGQQETLEARLRQRDLMRGDQIDTSLIAVFVSLDDRYLEIRYGDTWAAALKPRAEGIGSGTLGPNLREGNYTLAFVRALEALEGVIAGGSAAANAGQPISGSAFPSGNVQFPARRHSSANSQTLVYCLLGIAGLISFLYRLVTGNWGTSTNYGGGYYGSGPRFKSSSWGGGSHHSSGGGRSFGGGGRSSGKW